MSSVQHQPQADNESSDQLILHLLELHEGALAISSTLELSVILQRVVDTARRLTASRYAALGVVGEDGLITMFITSGIPAEEREVMGELPRGHGLLGVLIKEGKPIRIPNIAADQRSSGFPPNHPPMTTLLGMPIRYLGRVVGDLYLTDKEDGLFWSDEDEWLTGLLASHAAVAISNAYLYHELKLQQEHAEANHRRLAVIMAALPEGIVVCDKAGRVLLLNETAHLLLGWQVGDDVQARPYLTTQPDGSPYTTASLPLVHTLREGVALSGQQMTVSQPHGKVVDVLTSTAPLLDSSGTLAGAVAVYQDISQITELARLKDEFFSMATHELRTPLTSITMSSGLLAELLLAQGGRVAGLAALVDESARRLGTLVDDLLDLSRLEHGRLRLYCRPFDLCALLNRIVDETLPLAERKSQQLTVIADQSCALEADPGRIEQVVLNLIANAIKYTPAGGNIQVSVNYGRGVTTIAVADNGPGIPAHEREHIFERFYRREDEGTAQAGSGLGLPIARQLVELHGGRLWVEDVPGGGSIFRFTIPH